MYFKVTDLILGVGLVIGTLIFFRLLSDEKQMDYDIKRRRAWGLDRNGLMIVRRGGK